MCTTLPHIRADHVEHACVYPHFVESVHNMLRNDGMHDTYMTFYMPNMHDHCMAWTKMFYKYGTALLAQFGTEDIDVARLQTYTSLFVAGEHSAVNTRQNDITRRTFYYQGRMMNLRGNRSAMAVACANFVAYGLFTSGIGPALPELAIRTSSSLADLGGMFTALFFGALITQLISGPISDRIGQRPVLFGGLLLLAASVFGATWSSMLPVTFASTVLAGLGAGAVIVTTNLLVVQLFPERSTAALNLVNVFYCIGAVLGPVLAGLSLRLIGTALLPIWLGAGLMLLLLLPVLRLPQPQPAPVETQTVRTVSVWRSVPLWMIGLLVLLYVGLESGISGWLTAYIGRTTTQPVATAALAASAFWLALTIGRMVGALASMRVAPMVILTTCIGAALFGALLMHAGGGNVPMTTAAVLIIGLSFGPIYPTALAITAATFRHAAGTATSIIMALGSIGGMLIPPMLLFLLERGPALSTLLIIGGATGMFALHVWRGLLGRRRTNGRMNAERMNAERVSG